MMEVTNKTRADVKVMCSKGITVRQTLDFGPLLVQCWPSVGDAGPTLNQQWRVISCSLGGTFCAGKYIGAYPANTTHRSMSTTLAQHWSNSGSMSCACLLVILLCKDKLYHILVLHGRIYIYTIINLYIKKLYSWKLKFVFAI